MIRFVKNNEINSQKWNETIENSQFPTVFATFELLNVSVAPDSWCALILDDYVAVMPLPSRKKCGFNYIYHPFFVPQLGVFSKKPMSDELICSFFNKVTELYVLGDFVLNVGNIEFSKSFQTISYYQLKLDEQYKILHQKFSKNTKRNIKNAESFQFNLKLENDNIKSIINLFKNNRGDCVEVSFTDEDYRKCIEIADYLNKENLIETYSAYTRNGKLSAGAIFVHDGKRVWFWFSGRDNTNSEGNPMFFLINEFIKRHSNTEITFDFNGSVNPGVARMYKSFGGTPYNIPIVNIYKNRFWKLTSYLRRMFKNIAVR